jgi:SulP family sulfate permease
MKYVFSLDASSLVVLTELVTAAQRKGVRVFISGLTRQPLNVVKKSGLYEQIGPEFFFADQAEAVEAACLLVDQIKAEAQEEADKKAAEEAAREAAKEAAKKAADESGKENA